MSSLLDQFQTVSVRQGQIISTQGQLLDQAFIVKEGVVRVYNITADGEEKIIAFKSRDDIFSIGWLFYKHANSLYFYAAHTDCELYIVPREKFHQLLHEDPTMAQMLTSFLIREHVGGGLRLNALEESQSRDKILHILQVLCLRFGFELQTNIVQIEIPLRQQDIASMIGVSRETAAIELKRLKLQEVIGYRNCIYTVHTDKLSVLLPDEYNPGFHSNRI